MREGMEKVQDGARGRFTVGLQVILLVLIVLGGRGLSQAGVTCLTNVNKAMGQGGWCANVGEDETYALLRARHEESGYYEQTLGVTVREARAQFREVVDLIERHYVEGADWGELLAEGLRSCRLVTETEDMWAGYGRDGSDEEGLRDYLDEALRRTANEAVTGDDVRRVGDELAKKFGEAWVLVELMYGIADGLDAYSNMITPREFAAMQARLRGAYVGMGIDIAFTESYPVIFDVIEGAPADRAGLKPGDILLEAGGRTCERIGSGSLSRLLRGPEGSVIAVTIRRDGEELEARVGRERVAVPSVRHVQMLNVPAAERWAGGIERAGFVRLASFDLDTAMELRRCITRLENEGAEGLILDLRGNGGGVMRAAIDAARLFLAEGELVTVKEAGESVLYRAGGDNINFYEGPVVVLIDENTASAAEIFAAALHYHQRGFVVGSRSFGKSSVQTVYPLQEGGGALRLTTARYEPPSDSGGEFEGLEPHFSIKKGDFGLGAGISVRELLSGENRSLQYALQLLRTEKRS